MTDAAILTEKLTKHYGSLHAVQALDLCVPAGAVFGFLGPNRAGKTTTIRLLLKLVRPTAGRAWVLGQDVARGNSSFLMQVGALVESPAFYPYLSGRDNLRVFAHTGGYPDQKRIGEVLELVGLTDRQRDRVRTYSLGMKQRLAVAATLLNRPQLLFLDEPTNGLDPAGQAEIRELVRTLGKAGHTIFISSHLLHEIEQICDHVAIIDRGKLLRQGAVAELLGEQSALRIEADPIEQAAAIITRLTSSAPERTEDQQLLVHVPRERAPEIVQALGIAGVRVYQVVAERESLEQVFLRTTRDEALVHDEGKNP
ncbi:MAG TPA: ABC transporter ATP-binding protein [Anaerolineae bacterium]|nr:ABC transporter ATP-binding protein [Anaerolineae bacterium]